MSPGCFHDPVFVAVETLDPRAHLLTHLEKECGFSGGRYRVR